MATPIREIIKESSIYDMKVLDNLDSVTDPTVNDDSTLGYSRKSTWYNQSTGEIYRCIDASAGAAVWSLTTLTVDDLGTAALADSVDFATAAQGSLADSSIQPGDNISLLVNDSGFVDSTAISSAISLHEADANPHPQYFVTWAEYNNGSNPTTAPEANFTDALALGNGAIAGATYAFAFLGNAAGADSISIGRLSSASSSNGVAVGRSATSVGSSVAIGNNAVTGFGGEVAVGNFSNAGSYSTAVGSQAKATGTSSVAIGNGAEAAGNYAAAYGRDCDATQNYATSYGYQAVASGTDSTAVGARSDATALNAVAVGGGAQATASYTVALGHAAESSGGGSIAIGRNASAISNQSIAIGDQADAQNLHSIKIGSGHLTVHEHGVCFGYYAGTAWDGQFVLPDLANGTTYGRSGKKSFTTPEWVQTTSATPSVVSIPVNTAYALKAHRVEVEVLAHEPSTDEVWTQKITGLLHDLAGTLTLVGTNSDAAITSGGLTVSAALSVSGTSLNITVTGEAGKTIQWYTCVADLNSRT